MLRTCLPNTARISRVAVWGLANLPVASAPANSNPASIFSLTIRPNSRAVAGPPCIIRHERSATTIPTVGPQAEGVDHQVGQVGSWLRTKHGNPSAGTVDWKKEG